MFSDLPASGQHTLPPDPKGTAAIFRRVGYRLEDALADIIDNSIDAGATSILVRLVRGDNQLFRILVADNGRGMTEKKLDEIMRYGVQAKHKRGDLGKYGIGLKSASFSQCTSLTVVSRNQKETSGRRWTLTSIAHDWTVEVVDTKSARTFYNQNWGPLKIGKSGTVVIWDELELQLSSGSEFEKNIVSLLKEITNGLGLRFHRFVQKKKPRIFIDFQMHPSGDLAPPVPVRPLDPFGYTRPGRKGFPTDFLLNVKGLGRLKMRAHIWPPKSQDQNYKLGGGNVAGRQGFYFYRNGRLIQAGGWNKFQKSDHEPHSSLARVEIDLPPEFDSAFKLTIQKAAIEPPRAFLEALNDAYAGSMSFAQYLELAKAVYRNAEPDHELVYYVPGEGIPSSAIARIEKRMSDNWEGTPAQIEFEWKKLAKGIFFELNRDGARIGLNRLYRDAVTGGQNSKTDAALIKLLLFFICEESFDKQRLSGAQRDRLSLLNGALLDVIRSLR